MTFRIILIVLVAIPLDAALLVGPERPVTGVRFEPAGGNQEQPAIATNGTGFLVVWKDFRDTPRGDYIRAARVSRTGEVLDPFGIVVPSRGPRGEISAPMVFWTGADYLILWTVEFRNLYVSRIAADGTPVDSEPRLLASLDLPGFATAAWNGNRLLVVHRRGPDGRENPATALFVTIYSRDLQVVRSNVRVPAPAQIQWIPAAGSNGRDFMVAWRGDVVGLGTFVFASRLTESGDFIDDIPERLGPADSTLYKLFISSSGDTYLVTWATTAQVLGNVMPARGEPLRDAFTISAGSGLGKPVWTGTKYIVLVWPETWESPAADVSSVSVTTSGAVLDVKAVSTAPGHQIEAAAAAAGDRVLVVWRDGRRTPGIYPGDLFGSVLDTDGTVVVTERPITYSAPQQLTPAAAFEGRTFLAAWSEGDFYFRRVLAGRFDKDGTPLDGPGFLLHETPQGQFNPLVVFDGAQFVVIWGERTQFGNPGRLVGTRISVEGRVLDQPPFVIAEWVPVEQPSEFAIATDGIESVVAYRHWVDRAPIQVSRITRGGEVISTATLPLATDAYGASHPSIAFGRDSYVITWTESLRVLDPFPCQILCPIPSNPNILAARILPSGVMAESAPIAVATSTAAETHSTVAWGERFFLVTYWDSRGGTAAKRLDAQGRLVDRPPDAVGLPIDLPRAERRSTTFDGVTFVVAAAYQGDIFATRVSEAGVALDDPPGFFGSDPFTLEGSPFVLGLGRGESILLYEKSVKDAAFGVLRLFSRIVTQSVAPRRRAAR